MTFSVTEGDPDPAPAQATVTNGGRGTLAELWADVEYEGVASGWLRPELSGPVAPATLTVYPAVADLPPGEHHARVLVRSGGASNSPQSIAVSVTVSPAPRIELTPASVTFDVTWGDAAPAPQTVTVTNANGGELNDWMVSSITYGSGGSGWLSAIPGGPEAPEVLSLSADPDSLPAGTYNAAVEVTSASATNSPQTAVVTLRVRPGQLAMAGDCTRTCPIRCNLGDITATELHPNYNNRYTNSRTIQVPKYYWPGVPLQYYEVESRLYGSVSVSDGHSATVYTQFDVYIPYAVSRLIKEHAHLVQTGTFDFFGSGRTISAYNHQRMLDANVPYEVIDAEINAGANVYPYAREHSAHVTGSWTITYQCQDPP